MEVIMLKDATGSQNGTVVDKFVKGETYAVSDDLGKCFIGDKVAKVSTVALDKAAEDAKAADTPIVGSAPKKQATFKLPGAK